MRLLLFFGFGCVLSLCTLIASSRGDDSPGFFLKITKNVPRLGRRTDKHFDSYFLKNSKVIPRMGRGGENAVVDDVETQEPLSVERTQPGKRMLLSPVVAAAAAEREYSVVQPVNANTLIDLLERDAIPSENVKFVHWKDFDRALQMDVDLYTKVSLLGRTPDQRLKEDLRYSSQPLPIFDPLRESEIGREFGIYNKANRDMYPSQYRDFYYNHLK